MKFWSKIEKTSNPTSGFVLNEKWWPESNGPYPVTACSTPPEVLTQKAQ